MKVMKFLPIMLFSAALPLFVSCSQDDFVSDGVLPEGLYPIKISAVSLGAKPSVDTWGGASQTRVSESFGIDNVTDGNVVTCNPSWDDGDHINVLVSGGGYDGETMVCTLDKDGNVTDYEPQLYYKNTSDVTLTAWYTTHDDGNGTVDLSDQREELAHMMTGTATASYKEPVELTLKQSLLKIFAFFTGTVWTEGSVTSISLQSYTKCTHSNGEYTGHEGEEGEIKMMYNTDGSSMVESNDFREYTEFFEANVCPKCEITKYKINDGDWRTIDDRIYDVYESGELCRFQINIKNL